METKQNKDEDSTASSASKVTGDGAELDEEDQIGKGLATAAPTIDREEYLQAHRDLTFDKNQLQIKNNILHRRLAEYYKKRKLEHVLKPLEGATDLEEKYQQKLFSYEELKEKEDREVADISAKVQAVEFQYRERLDGAENAFNGLQSHEKNIGTGLIYSKKGKPIADKTVTRFLTLQRRKEEQACALRLRHIRARNAVAELETVVRKLETLGPGLYVAQYEQLYIDHQNFTNKIEVFIHLPIFSHIRARNAVAELETVVRKLETLGPALYVAQHEQLYIDHQKFTNKNRKRDDELIKNRAKCTEHNQILAHIREKMHHTDEVIDFTECDLGDAEMEYQRAREDLGMVKTRRDKLRWSLEAERRKAGLLTRKDLLRDFQDACDELEKLKERKEYLEDRIAKTSVGLRLGRTRVQSQSWEEGLD